MTYQKKASELTVQIVMQPARRSEKAVERHYQDTIVNPVVFEDHADVLAPSTLAQLGELFPGGSAPMWGIVPGKNQANLPQVRRIAAGDWVLFSGDKHVYFGGVIALTWQNQNLARRLWGNDHNDNTWEHMYALTAVRAFDVPIDELRDVLNWNPKRNIMGVTVLNQDESAILQDMLSLDDPAAGSAPTQAEPGSAGSTFTSELERQALRAIRGEQAHLKRHLLPGQAGRCALCGRDLPRELLVAAHIKKRSLCTDDEKRNISNIAMLACTLGCDALYEHGYVGVAPGGQIQASPYAANSPEVAAYIADRLFGRVVTCWSDSREPYFHWHYTHTFKDTPV